VDAKDGAGAGAETKLLSSGDTVVLSRLRHLTVVGCACDDSLNLLRFPRLESFVFFASIAPQASLSRLDALANSQLLEWLRVAARPCLDDAGLEPALQLPAWAS
jgi:hypothetical protein